MKNLKINNISEIVKNIETGFFKNEIYIETLADPTDLRDDLGWNFEDEDGALNAINVSIRYNGDAKNIQVFVTNDDNNETITIANSWGEVGDEEGLTALLNYINDHNLITKINSSHEFDEFEIKQHTYDVVFHDDDNMNNKGFEYSREDAIGYVESYNGTNASYFEDYKGGLVQVVCNETGEVVHEEEVK